MRTLRCWWFRLAGLLSPARREREMNDELADHLARYTAENIRNGMTPEEARRNAFLELGNPEAAKDAYRDRASAPVLEHLVLDLRFALRLLRKSPAFAATAILVLSLGMGAAIAIFAFVDGALLKPLPYPDSTRLVGVTESVPLFPRANLSYPDYLDWKRFNSVFQSLDVYDGGGFLVQTRTGAEPARAGRVSSGFLRTLGVQLFAGRDFSPSEEVAGGAHVVLLSYGTWQRRYGGRRDVVGTPVTLSGESYTVIGVLPANFHFAPLGAAEYWTTVDPAQSCLKRRSCHSLYGVARLKGGVSLKRALENVSAIASRLEQQYPDSNRGQGASVTPLADDIVGQIRPILLVLMGGAALLLLIACVNVASLVLVRAEGRRREMAVRGALGASTGRLLNQFLTEGLLLVSLAVACGLLLAHWGIQLLVVLIPADMARYMPFLLDVGLNTRILPWVAALAVSTVVLFSITPAIHLSLSRWRGGFLHSGLAEGTRGSAGTAWRRLGSRLAIVELATATVLLAGAGLFGKSLFHLLNVDLGLRPDHLATIVVAAPDSHYGKPEQQVALARQIVRQVHAIPGVESVALTSVLPVSFNGNTDWIRFVGKPYDGKHIEVNERAVSSEFFHTVGARLIRGRFFDDTEDQSKPSVVIVNRTLASRYFPGENPIGRQMGDTQLTPKSLRTIIGVIEDIRDGSLDAEIWPAEYRPFNQDPDTYCSVIARTSQRPEAVLPMLGPAIHRLFPDVGTDQEATMQFLIYNSVTAYLHRSAAWLVGGFALTALVLGLVGLYGVMAYSVSQRTREIGIRMALGAEHRSVYRLILGEAGAIAFTGILLGVAGSIGAASLAQKMLFGVSSWDYQTLLAVAVMLGAAALGASFVPARRAASVNPVEALRAE